MGKRGRKPRDWNSGIVGEHHICIVNHWFDYLFVGPEFIDVDDRGVLFELNRYGVRRVVQKHM